ncbi:MAG: amino acid racemase [Ruminococcaceae bacterium]|nr:amino acid racemase [Oscillospiraceae bacterium]
MATQDICRVLGILGGLGPMATVYFYEMLTEHTAAASDQDHIDILISSRATTPDRTAFILGKSTDNPLPTMIEEAKRLMQAGAEVLVLPCNTAHYFYDELSRATGAPFINIITETVAFCALRNMKTVGLLATEGTVTSGSYHTKCRDFGLNTITPCAASQALINEIIYDEIKRGLPPDMEKFGRVAYELREKGCDTLILGCTELSLLKKSGHLGKFYTDSLEILAAATIRRCGKTPIGFDFL